MEGNDTPLKGAGRAPRRWLASGGLLAAGLLAGGIIAGTRIAGAQGGTSTSTDAAAAAAQAANGAGHGPGETLLTGTTASKVRAAALAAVPGGTIIRLETDSEGSPYEAHVKKSDGSLVTLKFDKDFKMTDTIDGFGMGPRESQSGGSGA
jgi:hypothetical protein